MTHIENDYGEDLRRATEVLRQGGIILYPTDTVWGIGCDATNEDAVHRVFTIKGRQDNKALITLVGDHGALERAVESVPDIAYNLIEYTERPLTIVYDHGRGVAPAIMGGDGTLGVRLTREPFSAALCRALGRPLVSTSANFSGKPTPRTFAQIDPELAAQMDYVCLTGRDRQPGKPSIVMRLGESGLFKILRK